MGKVALLLIVITTIVVAQGIPVQQRKPLSSEPLLIPENVSSQLLCGSIALAATNADSKEGRKAGVDRDQQGNTFCGPIRRPLYPEVAKRAGIQGKVVLQAVIGKDGVVQYLKALEGHPLLISAALSAAKDWKYKPYRLNGKAVAVETTITVNFTLENFQVK